MRDASKVRSLLPIMMLSALGGCADCSPGNGPGEVSSPGDAGAPGTVDAQSPSAACAIGERACEGTCCPESMVCGESGGCCTRDELCGSTCCGAGQVCEAAVCRMDCGSTTRCESSDGTEECCEVDEVCASGSCITLDEPCTDFWECEAGTYCEPSVGYCLPLPQGAECQTGVTGGEVRPTTLWHWDGSGAAEPNYNQVMMTPVVANLSDDNGDGRVDVDDIPDVVFSAFCGAAGGACTPGEYNRDGLLRAVSGSDGSALFDVTDHHVIAGAQVALGDIDGDGLVEIIACGADPTGEGPLLAFENDGTLKWQTTDPAVRCGQSAPFLADLDADGSAEVVIRYTVVDATDGSVEWHHDCVNTGEFWNDGTLVRYEHLPCDYTTAADLDADGQLEVVGGNVAYRADGSTYFDRSAEFRDGYPAIGDLDLDGTPEIVVVHSAFNPAYAEGDHHMRVLNAAGQDIAGPVDINVPSVNNTASYLAHLADMRVSGGGPPTVANFGGDERPEIALAGGYGYAVFHGDLTLDWFAPTEDHSSRKTGSSVFDFDGDGKAEAVYNDEYWLRVYNGSDGSIQYCECNTSATHWEYPVIVDVNNDGHAEIVVASNDYFFHECPTDTDLDACTMERIAAGETEGVHGLRALAAPARDWVSTRRIWNQHTYHVTNVTETGGLPTGEHANWSLPELNNFRQNVQPGARNIPDLTPIDAAVDLGDCPSSLTLHFRVRNVGWAAAPAGVPITLDVDDGSGRRRLGGLATTRRLLPGEAEALSWPFPLTGDADPEADTRFFIVVNDPGDAPLPGFIECRDDNNQAEASGSCDLVF